MTQSEMIAHSPKNNGKLINFLRILQKSWNVQCHKSAMRRIKVNAHLTRDFMSTKDNRMTKQWYTVTP